MKLVLTVKSKQTYISLISKYVKVADRLRNLYYEAPDPRTGKKLHIWLKDLSTKKSLNEYLDQMDVMRDIETRYVSSKSEMRIP